MVPKALKMLEMHAWVRNKSFETDIECMKIWPLGNRLDNFQYINRIYKDIFTLRGVAKLEGGPEHHRSFTNQLTRFKPGGHIMPLTLLQAPPPTLQIQKAIYTSDAFKII